MGDIDKKQVLEKAIRTAIDNGWQQDRSAAVQFMINGRPELFYIGYDFLFNHDFAKALFSEKHKICSQCERAHFLSSDCDCGGWPYSAIENWKHHLRQMVISPDPIQYLAEYMEEQ